MKGKGRMRLEDNLDAGRVTIHTGEYIYIYRYRYINALKGHRLRAEQPQGSKGQITQTYSNTSDHPGCMHAEDSTSIGMYRALKRAVSECNLLNFLFAGYTYKTIQWSKAGSKSTLIETSFRTYEADSSILVFE